MQSVLILYWVASSVHNTDCHRFVNKNRKIRIRIITNCNRNNSLSLLCNCVNFKFWLANYSQSATTLLTVEIGTRFGIQPITYSNAIAIAWIILLFWSVIWHVLRFLFMFSRLKEEEEGGLKQRRKYFYAKLKLLKNNISNR